VSGGVVEPFAATGSHRSDGAPVFRRTEICAQQSDFAKCHGASMAVARSRRLPGDGGNERRFTVGILWIVIIVILVLALLGFFGRGRFYG
jgi:hypothetical protein